MKARERKQREARERNLSYGTLTLKQRIRHLDARLGVGVGATKQRAKLAAAIEKAKEASQ